MTRIGYFTGKLYDGAVDPSTIKECCMVLNYKEPIQDDEELVITKRRELRSRCAGCYQCEEAQRHAQ